MVSIEPIIQLALKEDIGSGDVTANLIASDTKAQANLLTREPMVLCGTEYFVEVFRQIDARVKIHWYFEDKTCVDVNEMLCTIEGSARSILTAERTALNFLQTLSGTATTTAQLVKKIAHTKARLLDTRKTLPGLRQAQKYAVICGGGVNHRMGLYDAFLIKENHIQAAGSITEAVKQARSFAKQLLLEVEVENLEGLQEALNCDVPRIMLDNFSLDKMQKAVNLNKGKAELEASGNVNETTIAAIAETGVDFISVGKITKDIKAIDLSLRFVNL